MRHMSSVYLRLTGSLNVVVLLLPMLTYSCASEVRVRR